jgi:hypothetical protein
LLDYERLCPTLLLRGQVQKRQWRRNRPINRIVRFVIVANLEGNVALGKDMRCVCRGVQLVLL